MSRNCVLGHFAGSGLKNDIQAEYCHYRALEPHSVAFLDMLATPPPPPPPPPLYRQKKNFPSTERFVMKTTRFLFTAILGLALSMELEQMKAEYRGLKK